MHGIELIVVLVLASSMLAGLARALNVHYAIVLVLGGLVLGFVPGMPTPRLRPDVVFFVFLPPLAYAASFGASTQDLRTHARPIGFLAIGLVLATVAAVAVVAHAVAGLAWGPAFVLGAILGPTDAVAATSVLRRLGAPERTSTILEGEALVNDGTGLTVYAAAVAAVTSGHFALASGVGKFVLVAAGGIAMGLAAGWVSTQVRRRIEDSKIEITISLLTAYLAYIPAERLGLSGILAAVTAGLYAGRHAGTMLSATSRLRTVAFWEVLTFLLESLLFLLIGLTLHQIVTGLSGGAGTIAVHAAVVTATLVVVRMAWMFVVPALVHFADPRNRSEPPRERKAELVVLGWSGMRGGVSLAAALAIPLAAGAHPFPSRSPVIFLAYVAIIVTLVVPGLTLPRLVARLNLGEGEEVRRAENRARAELARAALQRLEELEEDEGGQDGRAELLERLRGMYAARVENLENLEKLQQGQSGHGATASGEEEDEPEEIRYARWLRRELIALERERLSELRREDEVSAAAVRRIQRELDLEESRLVS